MHHGFYLPNRVGVDLQQAVDFCQFLFGLRALPYRHSVAVLGVHLGCHDDLSLRDAHDLVPSYVWVFLQLQAVLGASHGSLAAPIRLTLQGIATSIDANSVSGTFDVYSTNGMLVRRNVTSLRGLAPGVYLVRGRKVVVR